MTEPHVIEMPTKWSVQDYHVADVIKNGRVKFVWRTGEPDVYAIITQTVDLPFAVEFQPNRTNKSHLARRAHVMLVTEQNMFVVFESLCGRENTTIKDAHVHRHSGMIPVNTPDALKKICRHCVDVVEGENEHWVDDYPVEYDYKGNAVYEAVFPIMTAFVNEFDARAKTTFYTHANHKEFADFRFDKIFRLDDMIAEMTPDEKNAVAQIAADELKIKLREKLEHPGGGSDAIQHLFGISR